jgi:hypothetical protein
MELFSVLAKKEEYTEGSFGITDEKGLALPASRADALGRHL